MHGPCRPVCRACPRDDRPGRDHACSMHRGVVHAWMMDGRCVSCLPACATASAICIARPNYRDLAVGIRLPSLYYIHALMQMQMQMQLGLARERRCSCGCYSARSMTRVSWSMDRFNQGTVLSGTARGEPIIGAAHRARLHSSAVVQRSISESCSLLSSFPSCSK
jgi:hypothetical protein